MRPLNDLILIKALPDEEKTASGIVIPLNLNIPYKKGIVFRPSKHIDQVEPGETVLYYKNAKVLTEVKIEGEVYDLVREGGLMVAL